MVLWWYEIYSCIQFISENSDVQYVIFARNPDVYVFSRGTADVAKSPEIQGLVATWRHSVGADWVWPRNLVSGVTADVAKSFGSNRFRPNPAKSWISGDLAKSAVTCEKKYATGFRAKITHWTSRNSLVNQAELWILCKHNLLNICMFNFRFLF